MISVQKLSHNYILDQGYLKALERISFEVKTGEFVSIIGPSGGGKTTLLKAIGGLLDPTKGSIFVSGLHPRVAQSRKMIGFVFQDPSLLPWRTVRSNVTLPLELNDGSLATVDDPDRLLQAVGLADFANYYPYQISAGMKQRVALARALVFGPSVLLMDEPLGALDEMTRINMRYELLRLWDLSGKTAIMVTHSITEAVLLSDRVIVMSPRPGHVTDEVPISLSRPRRESQEQSVQFGDHVLRIKNMLQ